MRAVLSATVGLQIGEPRDFSASYEEVVDRAIGKSSPNLARARFKRAWLPALVTHVRASIWIKSSSGVRCV